MLGSVVPTGKVWPLVRWFNAASAPFPYKRRGAGSDSRGSGAVVGMAQDVAEERQLLAAQIGGIRDGESPPASACPTAPPGTAGLLLG